MFGKKSENWLIVGLGNPGREYEKTRHNCGFRAIDILAQKLGCQVDKAKFQGLYGQVSYNGCKLLLLKPMTYMNESGKAVGKIAQFYKIKPQNIIVIFDDTTLDVGRLRIRRSGSAGGHNGLKNILAHLGTDQFPRIKVGVGAPAHPEHEMVDWVIGNFTPAEKKVVEEAVM